MQTYCYSIPYVFFPAVLAVSGPLRLPALMCAARRSLALARIRHRLTTFLRFEARCTRPLPLWNLNLAALKRGPAAGRVSDRSLRKLTPPSPPLGGATAILFLA